MAYDPKVLQALRDNAARFSNAADREAYVAAAIVESGLNPRAVGDGGQSGGLFQEYSQGRGAGIPMSERFNPVGNARRAADEFLRYQGKYSGPELAYRAQRPADHSGYLSKLRAATAQARQILAGGAPSAGGQPAVAQPIAEPQGTSGLAPQQTGVDPIMSALTSGKTGTRQTAALAQGVVAAALSHAGAPSVSEREGVQINPTGADNQLGTGQAAIAAARTRLGTPYSWGGGTPSGPTRGFGRGANTVGFDCSSLVQYAWSKAGVSLPRTTWDQIKVGRGIPANDMSQWKPGDLIFPHAGHVQMYIGNGKVIQAPRTGGVVEISNARPAMAVRRPKG